MNSPTKVSFMLKSEGKYRKEFKKQICVIKLYNKIAKDYNYDEHDGESTIIEFGHYTPCQPMSTIEERKDKDNNIDILELTGHRWFNFGVGITKKYSGDYSEESIRAFVESMIDWNAIKVNSKDNDTSYHARSGDGMDAELEISVYPNRKY